MAEENVKAFFTKMEEDQSLGDGYKALLKEMGTSETTEEAALQRAAAFAAENGFEFTAEELKSAVTAAAEGELDSEDLDAVAGGGWGIGAFGMSDVEDGGGSFCIGAGINY